MAEPHLILFDCDGTIVDSEGLIVMAMTLAFEDAGLPAPDSAAIRRIIGLSLPIAVEALGAPPEHELLMKISEGYRTRYGDLRDHQGFEEPLFEGMLDLIKNFAARDEILLGVATGKTMKGVDTLLANYDITSLFHTIQTSDNAPSKPHPAMITQALSETGVAPHRAVMIGDTTFDMEMAENAGIPAIGVTWGHHAPEELTPFHPRSIVNTADELTSAINAVFHELKN